MNPPMSHPIHFPGLTPDASKIGPLAKRLQKRLNLFFYKKDLSCLFVSFMGGTGTGKSTLFNALCGAPLSATGVERPKTGGPVAYVHKTCPLESGSPFPHLDGVATAPDETEPSAGSPSQFTVISHDRTELSHLIIIDTPDLDSVAAEHRHMAEDLYHLSDALVFVTSQEKYADQVPHQFLKSALEDNVLLFILMNKAESESTRSDILDPLHLSGMSSEWTRLWFIPYRPTPDPNKLSKTPDFESFRRSFMRTLSEENASMVRQKRRRFQAEKLKKDLSHLFGLVDAENKAAEKWRSQLEAMCDETSRELIQAEKRRFSSQSREYLGREIRKLFDRYDILSKPRRLVKEMVLTPLRLLGLKKRPAPDSKENVLSRVREKSDLSNVAGAVEKLHRRVLENRSPHDTSAPLFSALRGAGLKLSDEDIRAMVWEEQEMLADWLEDKFDALARGIPKSKRLGIYSTTLLWGILIVSFETVVGGGFTILDAVLDSAIAPFITKGTVELFAYHEIQKIARGLAKQYQDGLVKVITRQYERYTKCLDALMPDEHAIMALKEARSRI
jgi:energy-coupling factor transporter ATP-binding protein EcfA2